MSVVCGHHVFERRRASPQRRRPCSSGARSDSRIPWLDTPPRARPTRDDEQAGARPYAQHFRRSVPTQHELTDGDQVRAQQLSLPRLRKYRSPATTPTRQLIGRRARRIVPARSRACPRSSTQRTSPSARTIRYSRVNGRPASTACMTDRSTCSRSSGWITLTNGRTALSMKSAAG